MTSEIIKPFSTIPENNHISPYPPEPTQANLPPERSEAHPEKSAEIPNSFHPSTKTPLEMPQTPSFQSENKPAEIQLHPSLSKNFYRFRRKVFKFFGGSFDLYDEHDKKVLYSHQKEFKLREDFRLYEDDLRSNELLKISTGDIFDFHATFHVDDSKSKKRIGSIKREWLQSTVRDEWTFLAPDGKTIIGKLQEKTPKRAFFTRLLGPLLVPQIYSISTPDGTIVAQVKQHRNPFVLKYDMDILTDHPPIDRRLLITSGILLTGIEGRQESWSASPHANSGMDVQLSSS